MYKRQHDIPISCSGATVRPGDLIFGDADGVVVIPPDNYEGLLAKAEESVVREVEMRRHFRVGGFPKINIERLYNTDVMAMINELKRFD